ncbi:MAG TPA: hypothetical protein VI643_04575 [Planctomycetota bacterium]|nr:hypothetical protein [Planctomycetota bacterium]
MPDVRTLLPLQDIDRRLYLLRRERARKPEELAGLKRAVVDAEGRFKEKDSAVKEMKVQGSKVDLEMKEMDDRIKKLDTDSLKSKKNSDFLAIKKAIGGIQADQSLVAEKWMEIEAKVEQATRAMKESELELKAAKGRLGTEEKRLQAEITLLDAEIHDLESKRKAALDGLDGEMLGIYERIIRSEGKSGQALAAVVKQSQSFQKKAKKGKGDGEPEPEQGGFSTFNYSCSGCNSELNLQDVNMLLIAREVRMCRNCSRILYYLDR